MLKLNKMEDICLDINKMLADIERSLNKLSQLDNSRGQQIANQIGNTLKTYSTNAATPESNFQANGLEDMISEVNVGNQIEEITNYIYQNCQKPLKFNLRFDANLTILTCRVTLYRVLMNIFESIAYSSLSADISTIDVHGHHTGNSIKITVLDGGQGFSEKMAQKISAYKRGNKKLLKTPCFDATTTLELIESLTGALSATTPEESGNQISLEFPYYIANKMIETDAGNVFALPVILHKGKTTKTPC